MKNIPHKYLAELLWFYTCNYECPFCAQNIRRQKYKNLIPKGKGAEPENIEKIISFFNNRPEKWDIKIAGGEITTHPQFVYLCQKLSERHNIQLITNNSISFERLNEFCEKIDSSRVNYFSCSLQPVDEEGERLEKFIERIIILKKHGFKAYVTYVATKERLIRIRSLKKKFEDSGIRFSVSVLIKNGAVENYTDEETALLDEVIDSISHRYNLEGEFQVVYGTLCDYGFTKVQIHGDTGDIMACRKYAKPIGNIYTGELTLKKSPINCPFKYCDCITVPLNNINKNNKRLSLAGSPDIIRYHYDKNIYEVFKKEVANPYYDNFNWNPCTGEEKQKTLERLKKANKARRMFYNAYKLQGDLFRDMGKLRASGLAYKKAIALEQEHEGNEPLLKKARFMTLPFLVKKSVSFLRKYFKKLDKYYGYAEIKTILELSFLQPIPDFPQFYDIESIEFADGGIVLQCGKTDPQIYLNLPHPLEKLASIPLCEVTYTNSVSGNLQLFWDYSGGLSEENSTRCDIEPSTEAVSISIPIVNWKDGAKLTAFRVDPPDGTRFVLKKVKFLEDK
jgi:organic radical activating enzyme